MDEKYIKGLLLLSQEPPGLEMKVKERQIEGRGTELLSL